MTAKQHNVSRESIQKEKIEMKITRIDNGEKTYWNKCPKCGQFADKVRTDWKSGRRQYIHDADNVCCVDTPRYLIDLLEGTPEEGLAILGHHKEKATKK